MTSLILIHWKLDASIFTPWTYCHKSSMWKSTKTFRLLLHKRAINSFSMFGRVHKFWKLKQVSWPKCWIISAQQKLLTPVSTSRYHALRRSNHSFRHFRFSLEMLTFHVYHFWQNLSQSFFFLVRKFAMEKFEKTHSWKHFPVMDALFHACVSLIA